MANAIGVGGLPGILAIKAQYWLPFVLAMGVAIVIPFILTFFFRKAGILTKAEDEAKADYVATPVTEEAVEAVKEEVATGTQCSYPQPTNW